MKNIQNEINAVTESFSPFVELFPSQHVHVNINELSMDEIRAELKRHGVKTRLKRKDKPTALLNSIRV